MATGKNTRSEKPDKHTKLLLFAGTVILLALVAVAVWLFCAAVSFM